MIVSGEPDGEPVVLLHAASLSAVQWYLQAEALGRTHRLYAVDLMGDIGLSRQRAEVHTRAQAADWLTTTLDGLELDRAALVGSSFGGFHATNLALARPDRVGSLALLAPAATLKPFKPLANLFIRTGSLLPLPMTVKPGLRGMMSGDLPDPRIVRQMQIGVAGFRYDRAGIFPSPVPDRRAGGPCLSDARAARRSGDRSTTRTRPPGARRRSSPTATSRSSQVSGTCSGCSGPTS